MSCYFVLFCSFLFWQQQNLIKASLKATILAKENIKRNSNKCLLTTDYSLSIEIYSFSVTYPLFLLIIYIIITIVFIFFLRLQKKFIFMVVAEIHLFIHSFIYSVLHFNSRLSSWLSVSHLFLHFFLKIVVYFLRH